MKRILGISLITATLFMSCKKDQTSFSSFEDNKEISIIENTPEGQKIGGMSYGLDNSHAGGTTEFGFNNSGNGLIRIDDEGAIYIAEGHGQPMDYNYWVDHQDEFKYEVFGRINGSEDPDVRTCNITIVIEDQGGGGGSNGPFVQERLDNGETPLDIWTSDATLLDSLYGKTYEGGLIFYLNTNDGTGLVAHPSDLPTDLPFDSRAGTDLTATGATSQVVGDGASNTTTIINEIGAGNGDYAAKMCDDLNSQGYTTWFLPTLDELDLMYDNLHAAGMGSFSNVDYWSSSEMTATASWARDFGVSSGQTCAAITKVNTHKVRPVKSF